MQEKNFQYQEKKWDEKLNLEEELQKELAKKLELESYASFEPQHLVMNEEGQRIAKKLEGLSLLKNRVKAQGAVVAADMLTADMEKEYKQRYHLSKKELERMLNEMQQGQVKDFQLKEDEYAPIQTGKRSELSKKMYAGRSELYQKLGKVLYDKRQNNPQMASFQLVSLEEDTISEYKKQYGLSKKELNKISLDIQTRAVSVEQYGNMPTIEEVIEERKNNVEEKNKARKINRILSEQELRENAQRRQARLDYLQSGIVVNTNKEEESKKEEWILAPYAKEAESILQNSKGDPMDMETVIQHAQEMKSNLLENRKILSDSVTKKLHQYQQKGLSEFLCEQIKQQIMSEFEKTHVREFLASKNEEQLYLGKEGKKVSIDNIIDGMLQTQNNQINQWISRGQRIDNEIGQNKINLSLTKSEQIQELYLLSEKEFEEKIKPLSKQARMNLKLVEMALQSRISVFNRENIFHQLVEKYGETMVTGTSTVVYDLTENYLDHLPEETKKFEETASTFIQSKIERSDVYSFMPQSAWNKLITKTIKVGDSAETIEKNLKKLASNTWGNLKDYAAGFKNKEFPQSIWKGLNEYKNEIADVSSPQFRQLLKEKLVYELLKPYEKHQDGKVIGYDFGEETLWGMEEARVFLAAKGLQIGYWEEKEEEEEEEEEINNLSKEDRFSNVAYLKGTELLEHSEFRIPLQEHHDLVIRVLNEILENEEEKKELGLECLENIHSVNDLDNLSFAEMKMVTSRLRQNLRNENLLVEMPIYTDKQEMLQVYLNQTLKEEGLKEVSCMEAFYYLKLEDEKRQKILNRMYEKLGTNNFDEIKVPTQLQSIRMVSYWEMKLGGYINKSRDIVMKEMLKGKLSQLTLPQLAKYVDKVMEDQKSIPTIRKIRTRFVLSVRENMFGSGIEVEDLPKDCYVVRNKEKFEDAHKAWTMLRKAGKEKEALQYCNTYADCKYSEDYHKGANSNPAEGIKELLRSLGTKEAEELSKKLRRGEKKNFMNEFLLCDYTEYCLRKDINTNINDTMTKVRTTDKEGEEEIFHVGSTIAFCVNEILKTLDKLKLSPEKYEAYRKKLIPFAMGLYKKDKLQQMKKVGVNFVQELCKEVETQKEYEEQRGKGDNEDKLLENQVNRYHKLQTYKNGILAPILSKLVQEDEFWIMMATKKEDDFFQKIDQLISEVRLPLEILESRFSSLGANFYDEICHRFAKEIVLGDKKSKVQWIQTFDDFFKEYSKYRLGDFNIADFTLKLREKDPQDPVIPYVTEILLSNKKGLDLAADEKELNNTLNNFRENIKANKEALEKEIGEYFVQHAEEFQKKNDPIGFVENRKEAFRKGCYMYLQTKLLYGEPTYFSTNLKQWMEDYVTLRAEMMKETKEITEEMALREKKLEDIHIHRDAGIQATAKDFARFSEVRTNLRKAGSPLLVALGVKKHVGKAQITKAKEKLEEKFADLPQVVKDCLLERMLTKVDDKTLQGEADWLHQVYVEAVYYMQFVAEEQKKLIPDEAKQKLISEVVLYSYILRKRLKKENMAVDKELISNSFEQVIGRHKRLSGLLDRQYTWEAEHNPIALNFNQDADAGFEMKENPVLAPSRHLVMESMASGFYTMEREEFDELLNRQKTFLEAAESADSNVFKDLVEKYVEAEYQMAARHALVDYFRAELVKGKDHQILNQTKMRQKVEEMLQDKQYREYLLSGVLMEEIDSETVLCPSVTIKDKRMDTLANKKVMESYLYRQKDFYGASVYGLEYNQLDYFQKQIFAMAILQWDEGEMLPSMQFVTSKELAESRQISVAKQLADYTSGMELSKLTMEIPYDRVIDRLCLSDGTINQEVYNDAMQRTKEYIQKRQSNLPKNYQILNDTVHSAEAAKHLLRQNPLFSQKEKEKNREKEVVVSNTQEWKEWLQGQWKKEQGNLAIEDAQKIETELEALNEYQFKLLILALNDRTMLDYSTCKIDNKTSMDFVNQEMRQLFTKHCTNARVYSNNLNKAVQTLKSYQLRDDIELLYGHLRTADFAEGALYRNTKIDWQLMIRALDFVKKLSADVVKN